MARLGATASIPCKSSAAIKLTHCGSQSLRQTPLQWEIVALVKASNVVAIEALVTDLHPGAQRAHVPRSSTANRIASARSEEHTSELQSRRDLVCRLLLEKKKKKKK